MNYRFIDKFYQSACIKQDKIIFQSVEILGSHVDIFIVENDCEIYILTKGRGYIDKPIPQNDIVQIILSGGEIKKLQELPLNKEVM